MEQTLQDTLEGANETVQQQPPSTRPEKSLQEKLYDIYVEECGKEPEAEGLRSNVNLLEKLMKREPLPCLVVSLYPENQGYSLMLKDKDGVLIEPYPGPYVGQKLLEYLNAEELPSFLIEILEKSPVNVFHSGCVIAEIRDYRQCGDIYPPEEPAAEAAVSSPACQVRHVLLRPTMQSLVSDVESMTTDSSQWTQEEKLELESQLTSATAEPLCLDPSVAVTCTANKLLFNEQKMNTNPMRQCFKRHACPALDQEEVPSGCSCPPDLTTMTPCKEQAKISPDNPSDLQIDGTETCNQSLCEPTVPSEMDLESFIKELLSLPFDETEPTISAIPEVKYDCMFDCEDDSQLWDRNEDIMECLNTLFNEEIEPLPEGSSANPMSLPPVALGDYSDDFLTGINTEPRKTVPMCQEAIQSQPTPEKKRSSSSVCPQPTPEKKRPSSSDCPQPNPEKKRPSSSVCPQPTPEKKQSCSSVCPQPNPEKKQSCSSVCPQPNPEKKRPSSSVCPQATPEKKRPSSSVCPQATPEKKRPSSSVCPQPTPEKKRPSSSVCPQATPEKKRPSSSVWPPQPTPEKKQPSSSVCPQPTPEKKRPSSSVCPQATPEKKRPSSSVCPQPTPEKKRPTGQPSARSSENNPKIQPPTRTTRVRVIRLSHRQNVQAQGFQVSAIVVRQGQRQGQTQNVHILGYAEPGTTTAFSSLCRCLLYMLHTDGLPSRARHQLGLGNVPSATAVQQSSTPATFWPQPHSGSKLVHGVE
ncbi:transcription factor SPT20 homolog [Microtus pennsylvanicus]|uniref:transcription factor SPT20 homolog n=1 Tax=Microtus pennsylvanicus TaxID=10058 RepID=UPI003F6CD3C3